MLDGGECLFWFFLLLARWNSSLWAAMSSSFERGGEVRRELPIFSIARRVRIREAFSVGLVKPV